MVLFAIILNWKQSNAERTIRISLSPFVVRRLSPLDLADRCEVAPDPRLLSSSSNFSFQNNADLAAPIAIPPTTSYREPSFGFTCQGGRIYHGLADTDSLISPQQQQ